MTMMDEEIAVAPTAAAMKQPATISVMAPSVMPGGYEFFADAGNGNSYKVRVPDGGVNAGDRFDAIIVKQSGGVNAMGTSVGVTDIPQGRWRDGLCDCCAFGCCHVVFCLGFWCRTCLLGQILVRNKLGILASPTGRMDPTAYHFWFAIMVITLVLGFLGNIILNSAGQYEEVRSTKDGYESVEFQYTGPAWASAINTTFSLITTVLSILACITTCRAREYLRQKYNIATENCGGCEDCCCAFWCGPCTLCQMARHTANYHAYPAQCCTATGLGPDAPEII